MNMLGVGLCSVPSGLCDVTTDSQHLEPREQAGTCFSVDQFLWVRSDLISVFLGVEPDFFLSEAEALKVFIFS